MNIPAEFIERVDGRFVYLSPAIYPREISEKSINDLAARIRLFPPFHAHFGGAGDALLLLSKFYDDNPRQDILSFATSPKAMRAFYDSFPLLRTVYLIQGPKGLLHAIVQNVLPLLQNCLGMGVTPRDYNKEWVPSLDIFRQYGIRPDPRWVQNFRSRKLEQFQVTLMPKGSILGVFRSKRNIVDPGAWRDILEFFESIGVRPILVGTPEEEAAYPGSKTSIDKRSYSFQEQMELIAGSDVFIGADTWGKTFSALASVPTIVFQSMTGFDLIGWQDSSEYVFIHPWRDISMVKDFREFREVFARHFPNMAARALTHTPSAKSSENARPGARKRHDSPPLSSFSSHFWDRNYSGISTVLVRSTGAVGDSLMLTTVVNALKRQHPHLDIYVSGNEVDKAVFWNHPAVTGFVPINSHEEIRLEAAIGAVIEYNFIIDILPDYFDKIHYMDILANIAGVRLNDCRIIYEVEGREAEWANSVRKSMGPGNRVVGLHLFSSKDFKRSYPYGPALVRHLGNIFPDARFVLFGQDGLGEANPFVLECSAHNIPLRHQIALAFRCDAFITVDSSFFHIAHNLCRKPTLALFGPTNPELCGDRSGGFTPLRKANLDCLSCYWSRQCEVECMKQLRPETVASAFSDMISSDGPARSPRVVSRKDLDVHVSPGENYEAAIRDCLIKHDGPMGLVLHDRERVLPAHAAQWNGAKVVQAPRTTVTWEGTQFVYHSLALINREICYRLITRDDMEVSLLPYEPDQFVPNGVPKFNTLAGRISAPLSRPSDIHIRHQWPPKFTPPPSGHWVMIQPWEYGMIPQGWVEPMSTLLDEIWVPSRYVMKGYLRSGIPGDRVRVVPNGVDTAIYNPGARPLELQSGGKFRFLFVGGTLWRKGIDLLLKAYLDTFTSRDDVALVIKDMGVNDFYKGMGYSESIRSIQKQPGAPELVYLTDSLSEQEMAGLMTACDCLVLPYRAEGFGLPVLEAMACGVPVIVTSGGATDDFCPPDIVYSVSAKKQFLPSTGQIQFAGGMGWFMEPDVDALKLQLRNVFHNAEEAGTKARRAREHAIAHYGWERIAEQVVMRIEAIGQKPVRRFM